MYVCVRECAIRPLKRKKLPHKGDRLNLFGASVQIEDVTAGGNQQVKEIQRPPARLIVHVPHHTMPQCFLPNAEQFTWLASCLLFVCVDIIRMTALIANLPIRDRCNDA